MTPVDFYPAEFLRQDVAYGFLNGTDHAPRRFHPRIVVNDGEQNVLHALREELKRSTAFTFSVAFITPRAIALLKQELLDFDGTGRIITSDYLSFNSPRAFEELLAIHRTCGVDVRVHESHAFHPKGYVFHGADSVTAMMGSSNLTESALASNHEWNLKVTAALESDLAKQLSSLVEREVDGSTRLTREWLDTYSATYVAPARMTSPARAEDVLDARITPNRMQQRALDALASVRSEGKDQALIVSATGTGKTILSALDARACAPKRLLFVVHREQILDRSIEEYQRVLGGRPDDYGKFTGGVKQQDRRYVFSTVQTLSRHLDEFAPNTFDYVIIDEAHRAGAEGHRAVLTHFTPRFLLGMTATPERTDDFDVFALFDHNVPYEIRLRHALEENMLAPFHYYGVADVEYADGSTIGDDSDLAVLVTHDRVNHLVSALEKYAQAGVAPRGLIFCSRVEEAEQLALALNSSVFRGRQLRTVPLSGSSTPDTREAVVKSLERGELDYILTVDIFNEGVDIPSINQVVMLRQTKSPIVFVQQLGRGLRKDPATHKEYLVVIDFIGNYAHNYMIPIALFGDSTLNKESIRKELITSDERGVLPGLSSVRFDRVSQDRILAAISDAKLSSLRNLREAVRKLHARLGRPPTLTDFWRLDSVDPCVLATQRKPPHFPALVASTLDLPNHFTPREDQMLMFLSRECLDAKRSYELTVIRALLSGNELAPNDVAALLNVNDGAPEVRSVTRVLTGQFQTNSEMSVYGRALVDFTEQRIIAREDLLESYRRNPAFRASVDDICAAGLEVNQSRYGSQNLIVGQQYSRKDVCRLLNWDNNEQGVIYGYKAHTASRTCPIFVTLHKNAEVSASTAYEDALLDPSTLLWYTRSKRTLSSPEVRAIVHHEVTSHVFIKKDDAEGSDFYYLGVARAESPEQTTMPDDAGNALSVVRMRLHFETHMPRGLYDYFHPTLAS